MSSFSNPPKQASAEEISETLRKEEEWVAGVEAKVAKSGELREGLLAILDSFEAHLQQLDATVNPLYRETRRRQIQQRNILKTLATVNTRIDHYSIAEDASISIGDCDPKTDLRRYLRSMEKLVQADAFFASAEQRQEAQLDRVRHSYETGCRALEQYFKDIVTRSVQQPLGPSILLAAVSDDYEVVPGALKAEQLVAESDRRTLVQLSEWLQKKAGRHDFLRFLAEKRALACLNCLKGIVNSRKSSSLGSSSSRPPPVGVSPKTDRKSSVGVVSGTKPPQFRKSSANPSVQRVSDQVYRRGNTMALEPLIEETAEKDAETFLLVLAAFRALLQAETMLLKAVVRSERLETTLFPILVVAPFTYALQQARPPLDATARLINQGEFGSILALCPLSHYLHTHDDALSTLAKNRKAGPEAESGSLEALHTATLRRLDELIVRGCDDFVNFIKTDVDKMVPKDGTVHQRTSNTLSLMKQLLEEREALSPLLADKDTPAQGALPKLFTRVLSSLGLCLRTKANSYALSEHRDLFLLNNFNHILNTLNASGMLSVVSEHNPQVGRHYETQVAQHIQTFVNYWAGLVTALGTYADHSPASATLTLPDKERNDVKTAFTNWNKELESVYASAEGLSVPDVELAARLRREIKERVYPRYLAFYNTFKGSNFTKNPDKYIKFLPETLSKLLDQLFDGQAA